MSGRGREVERASSSPAVIAVDDEGRLPAWVIDRIETDPQWALRELTTLTERALGPRPPLAPKGLRRVTPEVMAHIEVVGRIAELKRQADRDAPLLGPPPLGSRPTPDELAKPEREKHGGNYYAALNNWERIRARAADWDGYDARRAEVGPWAGLHFTGDAGGSRWNERVGAYVTDFVTVQCEKCGATLWRWNLGAGNYRRQCPPVDADLCARDAKYRTVLMLARMYQRDGDSGLAAKIYGDLDRLREFEQAEQWR